MTKKLSHYASTIENGVVVEHEGDENYAVYEEDIKEIQATAKLWHKWVDNNVPKAYNSWGMLKSGIYEKYYTEFLDTLTK